MDMFDESTRSFMRELAALFAARHEELYLVGGAIRDALRHERHPDLDFATSARPEITADLIESAGLGTPFRVGEAYGTIGVRAESRSIEITTYRSQEQYVRGSRKPTVQFGSTLAEDLTRRDFTVNAIAYDPVRGVLIDPLGGEVDIKVGIIRAVGEPERRFLDDPLRLLRAIRIAARYNFSIETHTWDAMQRTGETLTTISRERIRDEYEKILTGPAPARGIALLRDADLLRHSVPDLLQLTLMPDHGPQHPLSLWDHTSNVLAGVPAHADVRWAALLHDIAKPCTRTNEPDGRTRFFHHEKAGARVARSLLQGLRCPTSRIDNVSLLVETHMQVHAYSPHWSDGAVRRLAIRLGPLLPHAIELARADAAGHVGRAEGTSQNSPKFDALASRIAHLSASVPGTPHCPISGEDLMERYHRPPGRWIGGVKSAIEEEILEGTLAADDLAGAWSIADRLLNFAE